MQYKHGNEGNKGKESENNSDKTPEKIFPSD